MRDQRYDGRLFEAGLLITAFIGFGFLTYAMFF